ncbi:MAG: energy transducer TonB [Paludibacteraceae bacterium]|nr:energy transducer TonB [Paludibacteraceae bacterium]
MRGRQTCKILKQIRQEIAQANDINLVTKECKYKRDCLGTCPQCEAEVRFLESELAKRRNLGHKIALAGLSTGLFFNALSAQEASLLLSEEQIQQTVSTKLPVNGKRTIKGAVISEFGPEMGVHVLLNKELVCKTDSLGHFSVEVKNGDNLMILGSDMELVKITEETLDTLNYILYKIWGGTSSVKPSRASDCSWSCQVPMFVSAGLPFFHENPHKLERNISSFKELSDIQVKKDVEVKISFVVDKEGKVNDVELKKSSDERFNNVAMRVFNVNLKKSLWNPKKVMGKPVDSKHITTIIFHAK